MLRHGHLRVLVADEVGLGKTIQAGYIIAELANDNVEFRALVLVPAGLRDQWTSELESRFSLATIRADSPWLAAAVRTVPADINPWSLPGIYVASVDFVKRPEALHPLEALRWDLVVVDEAHTTAALSDRAVAVHAIARRARRVVLLTATPHTGDPGAFAALCATGAHPGEMPVLMFRRSRDSVGAGGRRRSRFLLVRPSTSERRMHRLLERYTDAVTREYAGVRGGELPLASVLLRKRALSSAASLVLSVRRRAVLLAQQPTPPLQLPLPIDEEHTAEDDVPEEVLAAPGLADGRRELALLREIAAAAGDVGSGETKLRVLLRLLVRAREPALIFTEYRDTLDHLHRAVTAAGIRACLLHGGLTLAERRRAVRTFEGGGFALLATDAASEGLNLHRACRLVIHFELPWNPARLEQRAGRVDRLGQHRRVHEIALVADDTAEGLVLAPLARRLARRSADDAFAFADLGESRVAAAVLARTGVGAIQGEGAEASTRRSPVSWSESSPGPDGSARRQPQAFVSPPPELRVAASREAARLAERRRLLRRGACENRLLRPAGEIVVSSMGRGRRVSRAVLVFLVQVFDGTGGIVASDGIAIDLRLGLDLPDRRAVSLRQAAARLIGGAGGRVATVLDRVLGTLLESIGPLQRHHLETLARRELALSNPGPSAARQLVQAGLFDRRALRSAARRHQDRVLDTEGTASAMRTFSEARALTTERHMRAVLLVTSRS
jgi:superfamily II DNA or RNA helicase